MERLAKEWQLVEDDEDDEAENENEEEYYEDEDEDEDDADGIQKCGRRKRGKWYQLTKRMKYLVEHEDFEKMQKIEGEHQSTSKSSKDSLRSTTKVMKFVQTELGLDELILL